MNSLFELACKVLVSLIVRNTQFLEIYCFYSNKKHGAHAKVSDCDLFYFDLCALTDMLPNFGDMVFKELALRATLTSLNMSNELAFYHDNIKTRITDLMIDEEWVKTNPSLDADENKKQIDDCEFERYELISYVKNKANTFGLCELFGELVIDEEQDHEKLNPEYVDFEFYDEEIKDRISSLKSEREWIDTLKSTKYKAQQISYFLINYNDLLYDVENIENVFNFRELFDEAEVALEIW